MNGSEMKNQRESIDWLVDTLTFLGLIVLIGMPVFVYGGLPDEIPSHYDGSGTPDRFSSKITIWFLPLIGVFLYGLLTSLTRVPHLFNYPTQITEENAQRQQRIAIKLVRARNLAIMSILFYINHTTIQIAHGNKEGLGALFLPTVLGGIFGIIFFYLYRAHKTE